MNPHIQEMKEDVLYHLTLGSGSHDLEKMFGDVKFVCMGGTPQRMKSFAGWRHLTLVAFSRLFSISRVHVDSTWLCFANWNMSGGH